MIIGYWSEAAGKGATTCNMLATALSMAVRCNKRMVLIQGKYDVNRIDNAFIPFMAENVMREDYGYYQYGGMDYLLRQAQQRRLHAGDIEQELVQVGGSNVFYLPAARQREGTLFDRQFKKIADAFLDTLTEFDKDTVILVELGNGLETITSHLLEVMQVLVINIAQEYHAIRQLGDNRALMEQSLFIVGRYDEASRMNVRNIYRRHHIDAQRIGVVPYHTGFKDAVSMGKSFRFFEKNSGLRARKNCVWDSVKTPVSAPERNRVPKAGKNYDTILFMKYVGKTAQMIMERCEIDIYGRDDRDREQGI